MKAEKEFVLRLTDQERMELLILVMDADASRHNPKFMFKLQQTLQPLKTLELDDTEIAVLKRALRNTDSEVFTGRDLGKIQRLHEELNKLCED